MAATDTPVFTAQQTHGRALRAGNQLVCHSQDAGWRSLYAARLREAPFHASESPIGHHSLIYHLAHPTEVMRRVQGEPRERAMIGPRRFCLTPGESSTEWQHAGHPEILQIYVHQSVFENTVGERSAGNSHRAELVPRFAILDPLLEQLALAILAALRDGDIADALYVDTTAQLMALHLARNYSSRYQPRRIAATDGLSPPRIRRIVDYIEAHLSDNLSLDTLANEAGLHPLYLSRVFKGALGQAPHQYVVSRRVERAKQLLRDTATPVADVAMATGFSSQSHLSTWFRRAVGVSPATYRRLS